MGRYRYALDTEDSCGGFCGPTFATRDGFSTSGEVTEAAIKDLLRRFPKAWASEPLRVHEECAS